MRCWTAAAMSRAVPLGFFGLLVLVAPSLAAMSPPEIQFACNSLARMAFDVKDLVKAVATTRNAGPFQVKRLLVWCDLRKKLMSDS